MRKSILVIEESKALNYVFGTIFKNNFDFFSANNYSEAFHYLRSEKFVDLILIDVPHDESDNFKFLAHISSSSLFCDIPTIVLSKSSDIHLKNKANALGVSFFATKPFDPVLLVEKVKELTNKKESIQFINETQ